MDLDMNNSLAEEGTYDTNTAPIVLENGSRTIKAGFADQLEPRFTFPNVVAKPRSQLLAESCPFYVGDGAISRMGIYKMSYPIAGGELINIEDLERVWEHTFSRELSIVPSEFQMLVTIPNLSNSINDSKFKMLELLFDKFHVPGVAAVHPSTLSLRNIGLSTGVVVHSGYSRTRITPVYEGVPLSYAKTSSCIAGSSVSGYLQLLMSQNGVAFTGNWDQPIVHQAKERNCYVSYDLDMEKKIAAESPGLLDAVFELPAPISQSLTLKQERYLAPEIMFDPSLVRENVVGIHKLVVDAINKCDEDMRKDLYKSIVLSGGNTMFPGFADRLHKEITQIAPSQTKVQIHTPNNQPNSIWAGGAKLASDSQLFNSSIITRAEYEECGLFFHKFCYDVL